MATAALLLAFVVLLGVDLARALRFMHRPDARQRTVGGGCRAVGDTTGDVPLSPSSSSSPPPPSAPRRRRPNESKYRQKDLLRGADGVPAAPVKVARGPVTSGGSGPKKIMSQGQPRASQILNPNKLKIIAGTAKGKKLESPSVYLRPMMAKVREALFSTLDHIGVFDVDTARVLDTFSGSGSVGLEALSRGAAHTTFVDLSPDCIATAQHNAATCGFEGRISAVCARAEEVLSAPAKFGLTEPYSLISITPPYEEVIYKTLIDAVCNSPLVVEDTLVIIEYPVEMGTLPYVLGDDKLFGVRNRRYGRTVLGLYVYRPNKKYDMRADEFEALK